MRVQGICSIMDTKDRNISGRVWHFYGIARIKVFWNDLKVIQENPNKYLCQVASYFPFFTRSFKYCSWATFTRESNELIENQIWEASVYPRDISGWWRCWDSWLAHVDANQQGGARDDSVFSESNGFFRMSRFGEEITKFWLGTTKSCSELKYPVQGWAKMKWKSRRGIFFLILLSF